MDMKIVLFKQPGLLGKRCFHKAYGYLGRFLHNVTQLPRNYKLTGALCKHRFYIKDISADAGPCKSRHDPRLCLLLYKLVMHRAHVEKFPEIINRHSDELCPGERRKFLLFRRIFAVSGRLRRCLFRLLFSIPGRLRYRFFCNALFRHRFFRHGLFRGLLLHCYLFCRGLLRFYPLCRVFLFIFLLRIRRLILVILNKLYRRAPAYSIYPLFQPSYTGLSGIILYDLIQGFVLHRKSPLGNPDGL